MPLPLTEEEKKLKHNTRIFNINKIDVDCTSRTKQYSQPRYNCTSPCQPVGWSSALTRQNNTLMRHTTLHPSNQNPVKYFENCNTNQCPPCPVNNMLVELIGTNLRVCFNTPIKSHATMSFEITPPIFSIEDYDVVNNTKCIDISIPAFNGEFSIRIILEGFGVHGGRILETFTIAPVFFNTMTITPSNMVITIGDAQILSICIDKATTKPASMRFEISPNNLTIENSKSQKNITLPDDSIDFPIGDTCVYASVITYTDVTTVGDHSVKLYFTADDMPNRTVIEEFTITVLPVYITSMTVSPTEVTLPQGGDTTVEICFSSTLKTKGILIFVSSGDLDIPSVSTANGDACVTVNIPIGLLTMATTHDITATLNGSYAENGSISTTFKVNVVMGIFSMTATNVTGIRGETKTTDITLNAAPTLANTITFNTLNIAPIHTNTSTKVYTTPIELLETTACGTIPVIAHITGENVPTFIDTPFVVTVSGNVTKIEMTTTLPVIIERGELHFDITIMVSVANAFLLNHAGIISFDVTPVVSNGLILDDIVTPPGISGIHHYIEHIDTSNDTALETYTITATYTGADACTPVSTTFDIKVDPVCVETSILTPFQTVKRGTPGTPVVITFSRPLEIEATISVSSTNNSIVVPTFTKPIGSLNFEIPLVTDYRAILGNCTVTVTITGGYICLGVTPIFLVVDINPNNQVLTQVDVFEPATAAAGRMLNADGTLFEYENYYPLSGVPQGQTFGQYAIVNEDRIVVVSRNINYLTIWKVAREEDPGAPLPNRIWQQELINWAGDPPPEGVGAFKTAVADDYLCFGIPSTPNIIHPATSAGLVKLLKRDNANVWNSITIKNPNPDKMSPPASPPAGADYFGQFFDISSKYLVVGAYAEHTGLAHNWAVGQGRAYVYNKNPITGFFNTTVDTNLFGINPIQPSAVPPPRIPPYTRAYEGAGNGYGYACATQYDNVLVSEVIVNNGIKNGAVHIYKPDSNGNINPTAVQTLTSIDANVVPFFQDGFGADIRTIKNKLIVGAPALQYDTFLLEPTTITLGFPPQGEVYIFDYIDGEYINGTLVLRPGGAPHAFGLYVGIGDFYYSVGVPTNNTNIGEVYFYGEMDDNHVGAATASGLVPIPNTHTCPPTIGTNTPDGYGWGNSYGNINNDSTLGQLCVVGARSASGAPVPSTTDPAGDPDSVCNYGRLYIFRVENTP